MDLTNMTWNSSSRWISDGMAADLDESGIINVHRFFYLFFNEEDLELLKTGRVDRQSTYYGKAIQINLSLSRGGNDNIDVVPWFRGSDNSTYMTIGMYVYDVIGYGSMNDFHCLSFILNDAMVSSTQNDYEIKKSMTYGVTLYSKELRDKPEKKSLLSSFDFECAPNVPEPKYYTLRQQENAENDVYCITTIDSVISHSGVELMDDYTTVSYMKLSDMDTFEPAMKSKLYNLRSSLMTSNSSVAAFDSTDLSNYTIFHDLITMQHGYTYIYDTQMGVNVIKSNKAFTPFTKYQFNDKLQEDIKSTLRMIDVYAKGVEKELGSVRLMFTPMYYGDRVDAFFKDWRADNQPTLKQNVGIDNESKIQTQISERLLDAELSMDDVYPPDGHVLC